MSALGRMLWPVLVACVGPLPSSPIASEPSPPTASMGLASRKGDEASIDAEPASAVETFGSLVNLHTAEAVALSPSEPSIDRFSSLTRDRVTGEQAAMDPKLLGLIQQLANQRSAVRVDVVSGYRSWKLNEMLRKKEHRVASHSQHSLGKAVDFRISGLTPKQLRDAIEHSNWPGGLGYYPTKSDRFVHADTGGNRRWVGH